MLEITFLGSGSAIPSKTRNHPSIALEYYGEQKETILFDCGEGTQKRLMEASISFMKIDKIFITHWHADHFAGLIPLIQTMNLEKRRKDLKIFGPEAERFVSDIIDLGYFGLRFPVEAINVDFEGDIIKKIDASEEFEIYSIPVLHTVPAVAFCFKEKDKWNIDKEKLKKLNLRGGRWLKKIKSLGEAEFKGKKIRLEQIADKKSGLKVVYTGDTKPCENVVKISKEADLLIHDGTFLESEDAKTKSHANVKEAAKVAKDANVKQLILTNISRRYTSTKEMEIESKKIFPNSKIAYDLMKVKLKT